jgi:hypothetical protein
MYVPGLAGPVKIAGQVYNSGKLTDCREPQHRSTAAPQHRSTAAP